jgi:hypothetical protein
MIFSSRRSNFGSEKDIVDGGGRERQWRVGVRATRLFGGARLPNDSMILTELPASSTQRLVKPIHSPSGDASGEHEEARIHGSATC